MKKQVQVLLKTGKKKYALVGLAELEIIPGWDSFCKKEVIKEIKLGKVTLHIKEGYTLYENPDKLWVE